MRLLVLWSSPSGYLLSQLASLHELGVEIVLYSERNEIDAPFDLQREYFFLKSFSNFDSKNRRELSEQVKEANPDVILICSWNNRSYLRIAREFSGIRILFMDNQWHGTLKQLGGVLLRSIYIWPHFDGVLLPGARQERFAKKLGFKYHQIARMGYSAEIEKFTSSNPALENRKFLYVGRLVPEKGIDVLLEAYVNYRNKVDNPWNLGIVGSGKLKEIIISKNIPGVSITEFVQPALLPSVFSSASCFILASKFEPWGVVLHEASASGLPIISSDACGSSDEFVEDGINGFIFKNGNDTELTSDMVKIHNLSKFDWKEMSDQSRVRAKRITPKLWARSLYDLVSAIGKVKDFK